MPRRPKLAAARAAVAGYDDANAAWETLATEGFIPTEWIHHDDRSYVMDTSTGTRRAYFPPTVRFCVLLAADAENIMAAEAVARETQRDVKRPGRILWRLVSPSQALWSESSLRETAQRTGAVVPLALRELGYWTDPNAWEEVTLLMRDDGDDAP
mgnify:CR=1 FL=1